MSFGIHGTFFDNLCRHVRRNTQDEMYILVSLTKSLLTKRNRRNPVSLFLSLKKKVIRKEYLNFETFPEISIKKYTKVELGIYDYVPRTVNKKDIKKKCFPLSRRRLRVRWCGIRDFTMDRTKCYKTVIYSIRVPLIERFNR